MKKYTRKGLIRYFEKLPPRSRPCKAGACPIAVFMGPVFITRHVSPAAASTTAIGFDPALAGVIDARLDNLIEGWCRLTAARIVKIAKAAPRV